MPWGSQQKRGEDFLVFAPSVPHTLTSAYEDTGNPLGNLLLEDGQCIIGRFAG